MKYNGVHLLAASAVLAAASGAFARNTEAPVTATIEGDKPAVIVFLPPSIQDPRDRKAVESAIESSKRCLGPEDVSYQTVSADRIVVRSRAREETFDVRDFAPLVGALLLRPGSNARILFAGGGPEALAQMLRFSASEYFGRACEDVETSR